ncbi:MAG: Gfo/Idh/MocA family oxidoreductase [Pyrinomonadaceae bacterium]|nr:Gfo/Idh/MocA family oxidoreductase [Sphingobacteriaceae bacterium]
MGGTKSNKNRKRIGIVGLGSIGVKHCLALKELGVTEIYALRTNKGNKVIPLELNGIVKYIFDNSEFENIDGFIISNPTSLHVESLKKLSDFNKPVFIEKPFCNEIEGFLLRNMDLTNINIQIGFCLRFNNVIKKVKEIIDSNIIGDIYHCRLNVGQFLPLWHPYTDYRNEYFSKKELGGGSIRTLSHEIDLAQYFFGKPSALKGYIDKVSNLEIDVDDYTLLLLNYNDLFVVRIEMDFLSKKPERNGKIYGKNFDLIYDVFLNRIEMYNKEGKLETYFVVASNDMYLEQMKTFLDIIDDPKGNFNNTAATLEESLLQLDLIKKAEYYSANDTWIKL